MSKSDSRYDTSDKDKSDNDECGESEDSDKSSSKSKSLTTSSSKSKDDNDDECKESDKDKSSGKSSSKSMSVASKSSSKDGKDKDKDKSDDDTCKVTICHIPPGNTCKPHEVRVGKSAVQAHIEHGDYPGTCDPVDPPLPPQCLQDLSACTVDAECCAGSVCLPDLASATGNSCGVAG